MMYFDFIDWTIVISIWLAGIGSMITIAKALRSISRKNMLERRIARLQRKLDESAE